MSGTCKAYSHIEVNEDDLETKQYLPELQKCQQDIDALGVKELEEILAIMKPIERNSKVSKICMFEQRNEAISKIPKFWSTVMKNCARLTLFVSQCDLEFLDHLTKFFVESTEENAQSGFRLYFYFDENPIIEETVLSKSIFWADSGDRESTSTPVHLKSNRNSLQSESLGSDITFLDWLNESEDPLSVNFMQLLEVWENPIQYYIMALEDDSTLTALEEAKHFQEQINILNKQVDEEMLKVTSSVGEAHEEESRELFQKRNEIISKIPLFWLIALSKHPQLSLTLTEDEFDYLQYLLRIDVEHKDKIDNEKSSMTIHFYMAEDNPFIENTVLSKEFFRGDNGERYCDSTPIKWKIEDPMLKEGHESNGNTFFDWYLDNSDPESNCHVTLPILQLWEDPVQYYLLSDVCTCCENDGKKESQDSLNVTETNDEDNP